ncbi:hypothetical protein V8F20_000070 [Naviculisporaceae sp. PSN 640]
MTGSTQFVDLQSIPPLALRRPSQVSNYSYPRSDSPIYFVPQQEGRRGSTGSDCSMPGMVEDQGSEVSTDDDYQTQARGTDLWDSFWQARVQEELGGARLQYPALLDTRASRQEPLLLANQEVQEAIRERSGSQTSQDATWPLPLTTSPTKRQTKTTPRTSYSLFPPKNDSPPVQPQTPPRRKPSEAESSSSSSPTKTRNVSRELEPKKVMEMAPTIRVVRRPLPATPRPQRTTMSASALAMKPLPKTPDQRRKSVRRVSGVNQHRRSISKAPTQSLPSLSSTMQTTQNKLPYSRSQTFNASSALPRQSERQPQAPHVSVFEFSDDEDGEDASSEKGFARRLVRGLTHHRDRNGSAKARIAHQRSVSDTPSNPSIDLTTTGDKVRRDRAGTIGTAGPGGEKRPSTAPGGSFGSDGTQKVKESRSRPWLSRQSSELFFGRLLGRRGN